MRELLSVQIRKRLPLETLQYSNYFRQRCCYVKQTAELLGVHRESLQNLFELYVEAEADVGDVTSSSRLMSYGEWALLLDDLGLFDANFSQREATYCFMRGAGCASRTSRTASSGSGCAT
eukprot:1427099-Prymnesium_polylepis.1